MDTIFTISGIFFLVKFLRRISRKRGTLCPTARFYRSQIQSCQGKVRLEIFRTGFSQKISGQCPPVPAEARGAGRGGGGAPFGWIRHTAGSDKCADEAFGWAMVAGMGWAIPEGREGLFFRFRFSGSAAWDGDLDAGILAKGAMRHFLKKREPGDCRVCRKNFLETSREMFVAKLCRERSRKYFLCARNFLRKISPGKSTYAIQTSSIRKIKIRLLIPSNSTGLETNRN